MLIEDRTFALFTALLKAVADSTRRRIMFLLREKGEMNVGEIAQQLEISQPTTSQHLRILKEAAAVKARKEGQQMFYSVFSIAVCDALMEFLMLYQKEVKQTKGDILW